MPAAENKCINWHKYFSLGSLCRFWKMVYLYHRHNQSANSERLKDAERGRDSRALSWFCIRLCFEAQDCCGTFLYFSWMWTLVYTVCIVLGWGLDKKSRRGSRLFRDCVPVTNFSCKYEVCRNFLCLKTLSQHDQMSLSISTHIK